LTDSSKVFDRITLLVSTTGVLVMAAILILVVRGPSAAGADADSTVAEIQLSEFSISGDLAVPEGAVALHVTNAGTIPHNLTLVGGPSTPDLNAGESATLNLGDMVAGQYQVICAVPGHESSGMTAMLTVGDVAMTDPHAGRTAAEYTAMDMAMTESILAFPASTEGIGNQPLEPVILADGTKQYDVTIAITSWEVEAGRFVEAWTYNGQVPGPAIRVDDGDRVSVTFHNELPMGTDVHFHGVRLENQMDGVAPLTQPLIEPGDSFTYSFVAVGPAVSMYHAHHHGQLQVPNGLFGTILIGETPIPMGRTIGGIEVPEDLEIVTEIPMVLNDAGVIGYSLNGKSFPATEPLVVALDDWFVVHYYNEGLQIHPMHLHGFPQLVFSKDGYPLDEPYWVDTLNVAPGERYSILVHADAAGAWVWHCHILNHVEREEGMFGMVTAVIVENE
jgi:uncharacterized cupredoxin-like copper-binding protein